MRIGEVARRSGVSARMLRHYDELGVVVPSGRSATGYREYAPADLRRLFEVESLRSLGMSLREIAAAVDDAPGRSSPTDLVECADHPHPRADRRGTGTAPPARTRAAGAPRRLGCGARRRRAAA
ncbi:MAG: MerR family transcriptional regulator [Gordonia sp. (in: high G+C Gram-positive bacteria)]|uniref:MerR family transcriptional regulator n=1 Tax=Gordonia sp. (in: high G+C Gram-positive bacteria) TaxID=84139 RepID=UPI0039E4A7E0